MPPHSKTPRPSSAIASVALIAVLAVLALVPTPAAADRGAPVAAPSAPQQTPEQQAADLYNRALAMQDKAWSLEEKAAGASGEEKAKLEEKAEKLYVRASRDFRSATSLNPKLHQAWSGLGYTLRKTGSYEEALAAYARALELEPNYAEAIEYRGEAYLGLNRVEDAKAAYMQLFASDRPRADKLLAAMKDWIARRRAEPGGVAPETVDSVAAWVEHRGELAGQTAGAAGGTAGSW